MVAAAQDVPASAGVVYNAGNPNNIQIVNFGTTIYTGSVDVTTTLERLLNNQSVVADESDDGGFFNFNPGELPNIPRMGMNYYMEFVVWPTMNLAANTFLTPRPLRTIHQTAFPVRSEFWLARVARFTSPAIITPRVIMSIPFLL